MGDATKSLAAEIEAVTERERTRLIAWLANHQTSTGSDIDREMTADALMADFIAPRLAEIAALQSRGFEDGGAVRQAAWDYASETWGVVWVENEFDHLCEFAALAKQEKGDA
jgi:hypothetical protein